MEFTELLTTEEMRNVITQNISRALNGGNHARTKHLKRALELQEKLNQSIEEDEKETADQDVTDCLS